MHDSVLGITGKIQNFDIRVWSRELLWQFPSAHPRHDNVRDQHINRPMIIGRDLQRGSPVISFQNLISLGFQSFTHQLSYRFLVFHQKHSFRTAGCRLRGTRHAGVFRRLFHARQVDAESSASADFALGKNVASTLLDNAVHGGQPQSGAFPFFFRGEERLKNSWLSFFIHAVTVVFNREHDIRSRLNVAAFAL